MQFTSSPKRLQTVVLIAWIIVDHSVIRSVSPGGEMLSQHSRSSKLAFGPFEFDPGSGELFRHGSRVRLASQPGTVLDALVDRSGELVTREDLRNRLWPGATSGDFEHGLNAAVNKLRQTLGDVADQPYYIETLPGVGYRFVAPVHPAGGAVLELVPNPAKSLQGPRLSQQRFPQWTAALAVLLVVLAAGAWTVLHRSPRPLAVRPTQLVILPPKGYYLEGGGVRQSFALSPDGERIAFTAKDSSGAFRLFLRDFSELESRPVADGDGAYSVVWTSDGRMLLFTSKSKLRRIAVNAAASQVLSDAIPYFSSAIPFGPDRILVSTARNSGVIPSSGGIPQPINRLYSWAQMLPVVGSSFTPLTIRNLIPCGLA
jgi:DNA-binding winged helix-turn-helix (wHTH) protein